MTSVAPAAEQRMAAVQAAVDALGPQLQSAASSGDFASMLSAVQSTVDQLDGIAAGAASSTASGTQTANSGVSGTLGTLGTLGGLGSLGSLGGLGTFGGLGSLGSGPAALSAQLASGTSGSLGAAVVADAQRYLGVPYQWGGTSASTGFDCSGLVQHVYGDLGIQLPRTSQQQATVGQAVPNLAAAQPGDLLFFEPGPGGPGHVGIYIGGGQMIDAPHTGTVVQVQSVSGEPTAIRRILPTVGMGATAASGSPLGVPSDLAPLFLAAGAKHGVSPQLLAAVAKVESGFDPTATSSAGAQGLMQIMPGTAQGLGIDPYNPAQAIDGAAQILSGDLQAFGSVPLALAAYNAGAGAVQQYGGIPPYPETQAYVSKIMGLLGAPA